MLSSTSSSPPTSTTTTTTPLQPLPESLSPCSNVRRTCHSLMKHEPFINNHNNNNNHSSNRTCSSKNTTRSVIIDSMSLKELAKKITQSIIDKTSTTKTTKTTETTTTTTNNTNNTEKNNVDKCISNLDFANWDADGWHYTGCNYSRPYLSKEEESKQRFERIALYVMIMDCINFCFWPVDDDDDAKGGKENLLEYEHLAIALKELAEADDILPMNARPPTITNTTYSDSTYVQAEDTYAFAPQNLIHLNEETFIKMIKLPSKNDNDDYHNKDNGTYSIPNPQERTRLIIELAQSLLISHNGSATSFISKANQSADMLVYLILQHFPGFRDTTVYNGYFVAFYKRAQILVADLWAALGSPNGSSLYKYCCFTDMDKITTFADYRVPQLLRHLNVLEYSPSLSKQIHDKMEIVPFSSDEVYIRAATVVAVDELVKEVKDIFNAMDSDLYKKYGEEVNAVKMDWYLWNIGEVLDRNNSMDRHHRVRTIFY